MSIEHCPRCSARVRVPVAAEPDSWVRCPRCRMESQLSEMLAAEPPELELIEGPSSVVPEYAPALAGVAAEADDFNEFNVTSGDTLVVDEDSPTLPLGSSSLLGGASLSHSAKSEDDELFGFDDNADVESLRTTSEDGKFIDVPADGDEEFNLSEEPSEDFGKASSAVPALGAGFTGVPTAAPRRKKKSSMVATLIGVVGGGVFGILIAYYGVLMWAMGQDPFNIAKHIPESMQMLLPAKFQNKALASKNNPPVDNTPDNTPINENNVPEPGPGPSPDQNPNPENNPPANDPLDPLAMPEKPKANADPLDPLASNLPDPKPSNDPLGVDPLGGNLPPPKPSNDPGDPFGNNPAKPEMPAKPEVTTPADPLDPLSPKPADPLTPKPADPLDPLTPKPADPLDPLTPKPADPLDPLTPKPADPLDPLATPQKPEMPAKPEVTTPADPLNPLTPADPLNPKPADPLTPKPADPLDPLTPKPADPLDPLAAKPVDPPAVPATPKASEPLMLASASFAPADLEQSLTAATASHETLTQKPEDRATQIASYRALSRLGEVAGQLKSLGETPEKSAEHLKALQTASKKLSSDPSIAGVSKWTAMWFSIAPEKRNTGIVLQGKPGASEAVGKYTRTVLELEVVAPGVTPPAMQPLKQAVVSEFPLVPNADGLVTVLGVIVDKPAEQIPGYTGPAERVIWVSVGEMEKPAAAPAPAPAGDAGAAPAPAAEPAKPAGDDPFGLK